MGVTWKGPRGTALSRRAKSARDRGPGTSVFNWIVGCFVVNVLGIGGH